MKMDRKLMRWRDTVKLFQMVGSDRGGQRRLAEEMMMGRQETGGPAEREHSQPR